MAATQGAAQFEIERSGLEPGGATHDAALAAARADGRLRMPDMTATRALDEIHASAIANGASDIHLEPLDSGGRVRERVDGTLRVVRSCGPDLFAQLVARAKLLAGMDIADRRTPQDGRYAIEGAARRVESRVSCMPTIAGEKVVLRLLDHHADVPALTDLGMPLESVPAFRSCIHAPHGFVVVCGPTGSGKTTTLYASLRDRNRSSDNLCTVEDPVEIRLPGVAQVQTNARAGVTFASALRGFLRQDPDVVMIGEMRDEETAGAAAAASLSGQLILTSLHAKDSFAAVRRLVELGVAPHSLAAGLTAVLSQRLLRRTCAACFGRAGGCASCYGAGFAGRVPVFETLLLDDTMRALIADGASAAILAAHAKQGGFRPMHMHAQERIAANLTNAEEVRRVLGDCA
ncbi:MAG: GspE/PulE family protein [Candidatus Baltobacteraceae bacterium]